MSKKTFSGFIAIVGRPNVGKSTLLNHLLEQKISITSRKPQTTRNNITGIKTVDNAQMVFVDTPGIHKGQSKAINQFMNKSASSAMKDVDIIIFVVDKDHWTDEDDAVLLQIQQLKNSDVNIVVVVNKLDQLKDKNAILPSLQVLSKKLPGAEIMPLSALQGQNLPELEQLLVSWLPENTHFYPDDQITDRTSRFMASEMIREKITRQLGAELPYQIAVEIENFEQTSQIINISALILVEREGQKRILIGDKGARLKQIGQQAREDMETLFDSKIMLRLWVKVKSGWSDDERALRSLGYSDPS